MWKVKWLLCWPTNIMYTSLWAEFTLTCLMHKGWKGLSLVSYLQGGPRTVLNKLSHPVLSAPSASHTSHCTNMNIPPLSSFAPNRPQLDGLMFLCSSLSLKQPRERCNAELHHWFHIPSRNSIFIQCFSLFWARDLWLVVQPTESVFSPILSLFVFFPFFAELQSWQRLCTAKELFTYISCIIN